MIAFKTPRIRDEYTQLPQKNPKLFELVVDLAAFVERYGQDLTLTSILRTPEEQAALYKPGTPAPAKSAHLSWEAVDLRSLVFKKEEIDEICAYLNQKYKNANGKPVAFCHTVAGGAPHFHVQLFR